MKQLIISTLARSRFIARRLAKRGDSFILMLHGVGDFDLRAVEFRRMLVELGEVFDFRRIDEVGREGTGGSQRPAIYLTFDDGLKNQFELAYPILQELAVPATFYVCPGLVETGEWIWTWEIRERITRMDPQGVERVAVEFDVPVRSVDSIMARLRAMPVAERKEAENYVRRASNGFRPDQKQRQRFDLMSWDDLRALDPRLILIGSHSMSHAMLDSVTPAEADTEVVKSRELLEENLDRDVAHFCYPNGYIGPVAEALVKKTYLTAVTTQGGTLEPTPADLYRLPRIGETGTVETMWWKLWQMARSGVRAKGDARVA